MTEFEQLVVSDLSVLKAQMAQLLGVGQPGRLHELEARVASHERSVQRLKGLAGALGGLMALVQVVMAWVGRK